MSQTASPRSSAVTAPAWTASASQAQAFWRGTLIIVTIPCLLLFGTAIGFGALARDVGLSLGNAAFVSMTMIALPNQVVLADEIGRGAALAAVALAVTLTGIRLLPMTVTFEFAATWPIAITTWIEGTRQLPSLPVGLRLAYHFGMGLGMMSTTVSGTIVGFLLAGRLPAVLAAALLFMVPIYFFLSLVMTSKTRADRLALGLGAMMGPVMFMLVPGFDLMLTGLGAGTAAYLAGRVRG
jgi:predicted branched-subunit amino acid permease